MKRTLSYLILPLFLIGVTGCMSEKDSNATSSEMLTYLEEKYDKKFEEEVYEEGSTLFPELYGGDRMIAHPSENEDIPFYVNKNVESEGFNDNYLLADLSYRFTEKHKQAIETMDGRDKAVKFSVGCRPRPQDPNYLEASVEDIMEEFSCNVSLNVAVKGEREGKEEAFVRELYKYMEENTSMFTVTVGYVKEDHFEEATELIRLAHTINFGWSQLGEGLFEYIYFESEDDINDPSFFEIL
jgi:hypothetical protein